MRLKDIDFTVQPDSRVARMPKPLQKVAIVGKRLVGWPEPPRYVYASDGLATMHYSPFLDDGDFASLYEAAAGRFPGDRPDLRWRVWILTRCGLQCRSLPGSYAEFGVYRGGCSFLVLSTAQLRPEQSFFLFDTFAGIPASSLTVNEERAGFAGRLADSSVAEVEELLGRWAPQVRLVVGDVLDKLPSTETGPLAFVHLDLNAAAPSAAALAYAYDRMVPGGMIVFDDYGWAGYEDQRSAINEFLAGKPEAVIALPTGQALLVKT